MEVDVECAEEEEGDGESHCERRAEGKEDVEEKDV
jgi:hypothetical protein